MSDLLASDANQDHYHQYDYNNYHRAMNNEDGLSKRNSYGYDDQYGYGEQDDTSRQDHHYGYGDHGGSHSGYGHHGHKDCCPLVVKPLVVAALLGGLALGTALLNLIVTMTIGRKRKRRSESKASLVKTHVQELMWAGMDNLNLNVHNIPVIYEIR